VAVEFGPTVGAGADLAGSEPKTRTAGDEPRAASAPVGVP
jgi:hypothetical protein